MSDGFARVKNVVRHILFAGFIAVIGAGMYGLDKLYTAVHQTLVLPEHSRTFLVAKGDTLTRVVYSLANEGVIKEPQWLLRYARLQEQHGIRAGEYEIDDTLTGKGLLQRLASGRVLQYQVTFIEGSKLSDVMAILASQQKLINDVKDMDPVAYQKFFGFTPQQAEGWIFPDTYSYVTGMKLSDVLLQAHHRMRAILDEEWQKRDKNLPYQNPYEALIMASIIEKETGHAPERSQIAGVFVRRLQKGMRLQTDPTVVYGLGDNFTGNLKKSHLMQPTPYNTYVIEGLPPTPICLPGRESIHAALHPASGNALFFVAKGDGTQFFSDNLAQHEQAVEEYQIRRKDGYRSAPPPKDAAPASAAALPAATATNPDIQASP
ncbi:MAG TPA: endolytic transglycosylase MltG [Pseudomonadales bacterium]|nr:endolytic transglycosylase MltG [Pseudomonadales bacterium]